jgi:hypothetical protein
MKRSGSEEIELRTLLIESLHLDSAAPAELVAQMECCRTELDKP